ncbi:hypothetical protein CC99x_005580 [Candidatus Berkiella cookevillensis]|uniref:Uncharacterized protein n=1 Tax=Candidatus Berkiella cookevillensis TaxID=437022 RepID=A0A0Q9YQS4_9GAMM|nr:hypothetical protein [Candidatus Berkiella cookevillensis]MCS5708373.1 hypothetical protein [Candidatus Berkiella cookevillensis]
MYSIKKIIKKLSVLTLFITHLLTAHAMPSDPTLIDYKVSGSGHSPYFSPENVVLILGRPYVLIIENDFDNAINFVFEKFGSTVYTHYLQGVSGMSQQNMTIPPHTKVTWMFEANQPGEFLVYAMNMGVGQKGEPSKLIVKSLRESAKPLPSDLAFESNGSSLSESLKALQRDIPDREQDESAQKAKEAQEENAAKQRKERKLKFWGGTSD